MNRIKILSCLIGFLFLSGNVWGQYSYKQHVKFADKSYEEGNFREALIHYDRAYQMTEYLSDDRLFNFAESAFNTFSLNTAQMQFEKYMELDSAEFQHIAAYRLAEISHMRGEYEAAIINYNLYASEFGEMNDTIDQKVDLLKAQAMWAESAEIESNIETVNLVEGNINSPFSENAPFIFMDSLHYGSLNQKVKDDDLNRYVSRIYREGSPFGVEGVSPAQLTSNLAFSPDSSFAIYSICDYGSEYEIQCQLYHAFVDSLGNLSGSTKLPDRINKSGSTTSHPSIILDGEDYILYFSSDRPGGEGNRDIWKSSFNSALEFKIPENLSLINTDQDDITPFYHDNTNTLYFSSNGHNGFGGYDVYKIAEGSMDSISIQNMGSLINTPYNDLYPYVNDNLSEIYFTSNRPGSQFLESQFESCCYDIYKAEVKECSIDLIAEFYDSFDDTELSDVSVQLIDKTNDVVVYNELVLGPQLEIQLDCDKEYEIVALKRGYQDLNYPLDDLNPIYGQENKVTKKIYMDPSDYNLSVKLYDLEEPELELNNAEVTLINVETGEEKKLANGNSHIYNFEILPKTSYKIIARKSAYDDTIVEFNSGVGEPDIEKVVYLKKTEIVQVTKVSLKNAIPVQLYFDNDQPDRKTMATTSTQNYSETYYNYYDQKDRYKRIYAGKFSRSQKADAEAEIDTLFENYIKAGFDKYENFKNQLLIVLEAGQKINIYLRGYASPVHASDYNIALGKRRVDSIRKEFDEWKDGIFIPYIESGQLVVTERSFGEDTAPEGISDDPGRPSQSIFSPEASIERRVEIDEINFEEN